MTEKIQRRCEFCPNLSFVNGGDGFFYCNGCGSQANDIIDMSVDNDDGCNVDGGIYRTSQCRPKRHQISLTYTDYYSEIRLRYVMGLQAMIQMQCKTLVEKFNVTPLIVGLAGPIWLRLLAHENVLSDEWAYNVINESESQTQGEGELPQPTGSQKTEPHNSLGKRAVTIWHKSLSSMIPLPCSLAISFLVCHVAREAILPTDILKWTLEGKLPYFAAFLEIEKQLGPPSRSCPISTIRMFRPIRTVTLQKLESLAASIATKIGLELPSVNFHAITARYLKHLSLPVEKILPQACQVYEWSMPPELYLSDNDSRLPSRVCVMSILIVTMRILYDLNDGKWESIASCSNNLVSAVENGAGERGFSCNARGAVAEDDSASHDADPHDSTSDMSKSNSDAVELLKIIEEKYNELSDTYEFSKDLHSYLRYCKDVVFAGLGPAYDDHEEKKLIEDLWNFYQSRKAGKASEDGKTRHGCSSRPKENENFRDDSYKCICKTSRDDGDSNATLRQLKVDMKENRFVYIPPRKNVKKKDGYIRYARKKDGAYLYAVHADYYILLRSCAKVAQVDVRTMHVGVLTFEKRLEMLEKRIGFCLCKRIPDDSCEFCRD
nr:TATA box-binding protein-associated factor RNA polymerase I subunit B [Solanum lycopersicum]XP_010326027.1 TATA box-binding protein-associated factor RNA polymerase I subunit B [Solanum lycopersicum]XP_019071201.1 TATA box-binding protein-associated factor RNA polymerase I subunit B [Solanum lycopersicum]